MKKILLAISLFGLTAYAQNVTKFEGLAQTPPMGWNSWNTFETHISESLVKEMADQLVASGMRDAGYTYIVLDDGWMARERDADGNLVPDPEKFPSGMKSLIDYVHAKGLKFGLYNCAGTKTCADYPGTRGYEYQDARFYAKLGIDYLKYDWCNTKGISAREAYATMSDALKTAGRPIVFSLCEWGDNQPWEWATPIGNLWRISGDIYPCFDCEFKHPENWSSWGVMRIVEMRKDIRKYAGPDHWNDFDMMEVGNGMTLAEDRSHFALWCMLASPLMAGNDLRAMTPATREILTNTELIAVNQDRLGIQGFRAEADNGLEVWVKPLSDGWAFTFLNRSDTPRTFQYDWTKHTITDPDFGATFDGKTVYAIRDLWAHRDKGTTQKPLSITLAPHDVTTLKLYKK
ncbi:MAG TPA: glycoside hydrolase family 27 protein [Flavobacterium sp.]|nr:glycoside hydrolase family 27 protein [Flavobacterium sp.]